MLTEFYILISEKIGLDNRPTIQVAMLKDCHLIIHIRAQPNGYAISCWKLYMTLFARFQLL